MDFEILWTLAEFTLLMIGLTLLQARSCLEYGLRECTVKLFEAAKIDRVECLDTQSKPPRCFEFVVGVL